MRRNELWGTLIVVVAAASILCYSAARAVGQVILLEDENEASPALAGGPLGIDTSTWETYYTPAFGFSFDYPPNWQIFTAGLSASTPFIVLGNPLSVNPLSVTSTQTYMMQIFVEKNPDDLSPGEYVHQLLADDRADDADNAASGLAPTVTPQFKTSYLTTVNGDPAYELFDVFEFDHNAEQIYVTHGTTTLRFDFPVADANPNIASPANNNAIAHMIVNTLTFSQ